MCGSTESNEALRPLQEVLTQVLDFFFVASVQERVDFVHHKMRNLREINILLGPVLLEAIQSSYS